MESTDNRRLTTLFIASMLALFLVEAMLFLLATWVLFRAARPNGLIAVVFGLAGLNFFLIGPGQRWFMTRECPSCTQQSLKYVERAHGYECMECRARFIRLTILSKWVDVSGPENDMFFRRRATSGSVWTGYTPPNPGKTGVGALLRNKWIRNRSGPIKPVAQAPPPSSRDPLHDPWLDD